MESFFFSFREVSLDKSNTRRVSRHPRSPINVRNPPFAHSHVKNVIKYCPFHAFSDELFMFRTIEEL